MKVIVPTPTKVKIGLTTINCVFDQLCNTYRFLVCVTLHLSKNVGEGVSQLECSRIIIESLMY